LRADELWVTLGAPGPQGHAGPQGIPGPAGASGAPGPPGRAQNGGWRASSYTPLIIIIGTEFIEA